MPWEQAVDCLERLQHISDLSFSADGSRLIATLSPSSHIKGESAASRIWSYPLQGQAHQLTFGPNSDGVPRPAPNDDRLAFASDRLVQGKMDLFLREADGSVRQLGDIPGSVEDIAWRDGGTTLIVLSADKGLNGGATNGATRLWWGDDPDPAQDKPQGRYRRLFAVDLASGATREVGPTDLTVWEFALVDGGAVAVVSGDASERGWHHPEIVRIDFSSRAVVPLYRSDWQIQGISVSPDGQKLAFLEGWSSDRGLVAGEMRIMDLAGTGKSPVSLAAASHSNITQLQWRDKSSLWFTGWKSLGAIHGIVSTEGQIVSEHYEEATLGEDPFVARMTVSPRGDRLAGIRETIGHPQEIFVKAADADSWTQLSHVNEEVARSYPDYPEIRRIAWQGEDGLALEAFLLVPSDASDAPLPMIVEIHGGPCMSIKYGFNPSSALGLAAAGYAVFVPNYRGNVGWGQDFTRMNIGDPAGGEFSDILKGVDKCVELGIADPQRLGVTGTSYGGYLSNWAVATTDRFKAAVPMFSISNQISSHFSCEHDFHEFINGGSLREAKYRNIAWDRSPLARLNKPTTPTLLIQGVEDRCTPLGQAQEFYAALVGLGVTCELIAYPREGHGLQETAHRRHAWQQRIGWFDRFLKGHNS